MTTPALRIFYFDSDKTELLLGPVRALCEAIVSALGETPVWLQSNWRLGPHVDVIVETDKETFDEVVMPLAWMIVAPWLAANPSATRLDPEDYLALSKKLALYELVNAPLGPLAENNSIEAAWHEPNLEQFGVEELLLARARFNQISLWAIFDAVAIKRSDVNGFYLRLCEMFALIGNLVPRHGLPRSFMSYRSHAAYFFTNHDSSGRIRAQMDAADARLAGEVDRIVQLADAVYREETSVDEAFPALAEWYKAQQQLSREVYQAAEAHSDILGQTSRLARLADEVVAAVNIPLDPAKERRTSEVESYIGDIDDLFKQVSHIAFRTMVNYLYGILPIMSVSPVQKYSLCNLVANACERSFGKSWRDVVDAGRVAQGAQA